MKHSDVLQSIVAGTYQSSFAPIVQNKQRDVRLSHLNLELLALDGHVFRLISGAVQVLRKGRSTRLLLPVSAEGMCASCQLGFKGRHKKTRLFKRINVLAGHSGA